MRWRLCAAALGLAQPVFATDIVNKDGRTYVVVISSGGAPTKTEIAAKSVKIAVCETKATKCVVSVDGVGEIEVTGADDVVIENARLSKN